MRPLYIAILGCRGIPNRYGGFEQFAEYLSVGLVQRGHRVRVYSSHTHPYQEATFQGVEIVHANDPEDRIGTAGQFLYDLNCILHLRRHPVEVVLQLGYTSSSIWGWLLPRVPVVTNMDGLEWKRSKYSAPVRRFLYWAEALGARWSDALVADSLGIQQHLRQRFGKDSTYIPYGAEPFQPSPTDAAAVLPTYGLQPHGYDMLIARLEPENNLEMVLRGTLQSSSQRPLLVIGKHETKFGEYLKQHFAHDPRVRFLGAIYDQHALNVLRWHCNLYFHGHSVGGTNPSLLEAMASGALMAAHRNVFNQTILGAEAHYFDTPAEVTALRDSPGRSAPDAPQWVATNLHRIATLYARDTIVAQYESLLLQAAEKGVMR